MDSVVTEHIGTYVSRSRSLLPFIKVTYHGIDTRNNHVGYVVLDLTQCSSHEADQVSALFFNGDRLLFVHFFEVVFNRRSHFRSNFSVGRSLVYSVATSKLRNRELRVRHNQHLARLCQLLYNQFNRLYGVGDIRHDDPLDSELCGDTGSQCFLDILFGEEHPVKGARCVLCAKDAEDSLCTQFDSCSQNRETLTVCDVIT